MFPLSEHGEIDADAFCLTSPPQATPPLTDLVLELPGWQK